MIKLLPVTLAAALALAPAALAQDSGQGQPDQSAPPAYQGPIVGGKNIQPTQGEITERLMQQREEEGKGGQPPVRQNDKELDELYEQLLQQSGPSRGQ